MGAVAFDGKGFLFVEVLADEPDEILTDDCVAATPLVDGLWDEEEEEEAGGAAVVDADCMVGDMVGA
jgi:hypothetical protein